MADRDEPLALSRPELRAVAGYAAACARSVLELFEQARPQDPRPRAAIEAAQAFADGTERTRALRDCAWAAQRAAREARDAGQAAASEAARAALAAAGAAFLHPLARATQVRHVLGSAAHAARAAELAAGGHPDGGPAGDAPAAGASTAGASTASATDVAADHLARSRALAPPAVVAVLRRYPAAPAGGGRVGELVRQLDASLRGDPG